jgi:hypothetical protein
MIWPEKCMAGGESGIASFRKEISPWHPLKPLSKPP